MSSHTVLSVNRLPLCPMFTWKIIEWLIEIIQASKTIYFWATWPTIRQFRLHFGVSLVSVCSQLCFLTFFNLKTYLKKILFAFLFLIFFFLLHLAFEIHFALKANLFFLLTMKANEVTFFNYFKDFILCILKCWSKVCLKAHPSQRN